MTLDPNTASSPSSSSSASGANTTQAGRRRGKHRSVDTGGRKPQLPGTGEEIFGFRLRHELGRGAFARVYLAEQADLASRPVVLKVSDLEGDEPQTLAQLQHTHIVPIYSVHEDAGRGLRAVCMPYFGGASLSDVLEILWGKTKRPGQGKELVDALGSIPAPPKPVAPSELLVDALIPESGAADTALTMLGEESYPRAAAWIVARLAEALQHAHHRGVIHRDVKPSNVLLGGDGSPMLLDFNVSQNTRNSRKTTALGGTVAYMAPEHLRALASTDEGLAARVDHRADIYSLGMVLYEMLAGGRPFAHTGSYSPGLPVLIAMALERGNTAPSLRGQRSDVAWSLESIVRKALAPTPGERYQQAEHFAEDLRRFLEDRPLKYAPELSWSERARKWMRRHPRVTSSASVGTAAVLLLAALGVSLIGVRGHLEKTREQLAVAESEDRQQAFEAGTVRALCRINTTTLIEDHLREGIAGCEQTLGLYGVLDGEDWQAGPHWRRLGQEKRVRLAEDIRELLLLLAWARVQSAPGDVGALELALTLVGKAEAIEGLEPSRALWESRAYYLRKQGKGEEAQAAQKQGEQLRPAGARDHYLLAIGFAREGRYADAVGHLDTALGLNPRHYWSLVQRGLCYQELGKVALAAADFGACIGLIPDLEWGYFNRGYIFEKAGSKVEAIRDYTTAIERAPGFVLAYMNRGMVRLELLRHREALADFDEAKKLGRDGATVHLGRGVALEGLGKAAEADAAFEEAFRLAVNEPPEKRARLTWVYGMAVAKRLPTKAAAAFDSVLAKTPNHAQALYGRALLLVEEGKETEAIGLFDRAIESAPNLSEAWRFRAVLRARAGHFARASEEINLCLEREPDSGATHYAAACVAALAAGKTSNPDFAKQAGEQALVFLTRAFALNYGKEQAVKDPDLRSLRDLDGFRKLLESRAATKP